MNPRAQRQMFLLFLMLLVAVGFMVYQNRKSIQALKENQRLYRQARQFAGRPVNVAAEGQGSDPGTANAEPKTITCPQFFNRLETLPLESLMFELKEKQLVPPDKCDQDPISNELFSKFLTACSRENLDSNVPARNEMCEQALFQFRARRIQLWTQGQELKELSTDILVQRFFGLLVSGALRAPAGAEEIRALAVEMRNRMPESAAPYRIAVASYLEDQNLSPLESQQYDIVLREARLRDPEDWQLFEVELLKKLKEDPAAYEQSVGEFLASEPNLPTSLYHGGCVAWTRGNRDQALEYFRRAAEGAPQDPRFTETFQRSQAANLGSAICTSPLTFRLEDF